MNRELTRLSKAQLIAEVERLQGEMAAFPALGVPPRAILEALETTLRNAPIATSVIGPDGEIIFVGGRRVHAFGLNPTASIGNDYVGQFSGRADLVEAIGEAVAGRAVNIVERVGEYSFEVWLAPLDPEHVPSPVACLAFDVSERARTEVALRADRQLFEELVHSAAVPVIVRDLDCRYQYVNKEFERRSGYRLEEIRGKSLYDVIAPELADQFIEQTRQVIEQGVPLTWSVDVPDAGGNWMMLMRTQYPILDSGGRIIATGVIDIDITERQRAELAMQQARRIAEEANRAKSRFLAAASHDLRQPLHAMGLFLSLLQSSYEDERQALLINRLAQSVASLNRLFDALLDISRLEAGTVVPNPESFAVQTLLDTLFNEFEPAARAKNLRLRRVPCRATVTTDPALLESILRNLISNALRYTDAGGILIGCRRAGDKLRIEVWDSGAGMDEEEIEQAFTEFERLPRHRRLHQGDSMGLGLAIVRRTARLLGVSVDARSRAAQGSCFSVTLPASAATVSRPLREAPQSDGHGSVLGRVVVVIDDDESVLSATLQTLEGWRCLAIAGGTAEEAVAQCRRAGLVPDAVIADLRLAGEVRGTDAIGRLERAFGRSLPCVMVTGEAMPLARSEAEARGYPVLVKPVDPAHMLATLARVIGRAEGDPAKA